MASKESGHVFSGGDEPAASSSSAMDVKKEEEEGAPKKGRGSSGKSAAKSGSDRKGEENGAGDTKSVVPVDADWPFRNFKVYVDSSTIWDCTLIQVNIDKNKNKYYKMQLLKEVDKEEYYIWQRRDRLGYTRNDYLKDYANLKEAQEFFKKKFHEKTKNHWVNKDNFVQQPGKFDLVHLSTESAFDMAPLQEALGETRDDAPFGKLAEKQIEAGRTALKEIKDLIEAKDFGPKLTNACNVFYTKIPHKFELRTPPPLIQTMEQVEKKMRLLEESAFDMAPLQEALGETRDDAPFGKLAEKQIEAGRTALKEIKDLIEAKDFGPKLTNACNVFYTKIPHKFELRTPPPLIQAMEQVEKKMRLLEEALEEIRDDAPLAEGGDEPAASSSSAVDVKKEEEEEALKDVKGSSGKSAAKSGSDRKGEENGAVKVDDDDPPKSCSLYKDKYPPTILDCTLNQVNIDENENQFYKMQLQKEVDKVYYVRQHWGRVGYEGQNILVPPTGENLPRAEEVFREKFFEMTDNDWDNRHNFEKKPGKFDLVHLAKEALEEIRDDAPLGKLANIQIEWGRRALKVIEDLIKAEDLGPNLKDACNVFYTKIPHNFEMRTPPLIQAMEQVEEKKRLLERLMEEA